MKAPVNHALRAGRIWDFLVGVARAGRTTNYAELAKAVGCHWRPLAQPLGLIQDHCLQEGLEPLSILVVGKSGGMPGAGFIAWDIGNLEEGLARVHQFHWHRVVNPFAFALQGYTEPQVVERLLTEPAAAEDIYALVRVRGVCQRIFREALMRAYGRACAFCALTFPEALESAHIVPWPASSRSERLDVRNGLLLCATHHRLFDSGWLRLTTNLTIEHVEATGRYTTADEQLTRGLVGARVRVPKRREHWPNVKFISRRNELLR